MAARECASHARALTRSKENAGEAEQRLRSRRAAARGPGANAGAAGGEAFRHGGKADTALPPCQWGRPRRRAVTSPRFHNLHRLR